MQYHVSMKQFDEKPPPHLICSFSATETSVSGFLHTTASLLVGKSSYDSLWVLLPLPCLTAHQFNSVQFSSVAQSCPTLCDPMNHSMPGLPVYHCPYLHTIPATARYQATAQGQILAQRSSWDLTERHLLIIRACLPLLSYHI